MKKARDSADAVNQWLAHAREDSYTAEAIPLTIADVEYALLCARELIRETLSGFGGEALCIGTTHLAGVILKRLQYRRDGSFTD